MTESGSDGALDEVYQMIADVPAILERAVMLSSIDEQTDLLKESSAVARSILVMVKSVESWHDRFSKASSTPRSWSVPSYATNPADVDPSNKVFPFFFEFESLSVAIPVVMCWAVSAQLYSNLIQIYELVETRLGHHIDLEYLLAQADATSVSVENPLEASTQKSILFNAGESGSIQYFHNEGTRMARYVCQSLGYFHRIEMGTYGGHATTYPSWSARQYFRLHPGHEREWSWLQNMHKMEGSGTRWGLSMMTFADIVEPLSGWPK